MNKEMLEKRIEYSHNLLLFGKLLKAQLVKDQEHERQTVKRIKREIETTFGDAVEIHVRLPEWHEFWKGLEVE